VARLSHIRRADELWSRCDGRVSSGGRVHWPHSQGGEARGVAGCAVFEIRAGHQSADGADTRPHRAADAHRPRRRGDRVKRREFIALLGGAAAWPLAARAQQLVDKFPKIGFLQGVQNENVVAFIQALRAAGYTDGQNVRIETRIYGTMLDRLGELARELADLQCSAIVAAAPYAIRAATGATSTIPIVGIDLESDPVASGGAKSLSRPGGNVTGLFLDIPELGGKLIELLREAVPTLSRLGVLWDATIGAVQFRATEAAARDARIELHSLPIQRAGDLDSVFNRAVSERVEGM